MPPPKPPFSKAVSHVEHRDRSLVETLDYALQGRPEFKDERDNHQRVAEAVARRFPEFATVAPAMLASLREGTPAAPLPAGFLAAVAATLEFPESYFVDWRVTTTTDVIIAVGGALNSHGMTMIGPCRVFLWDPLTRAVMYCRWLNGSSHFMAPVDEGELERV